MLIKSAFLCDDCFKSANKRSQEQQNKLPQHANSSTSVGNSSQSTPVSSVINKKLTESITEVNEISPDDDGYCEIDEIRLPAITKSPSIKVKDPRRQSAAAPLPPEAKECVVESSSKSNATDDMTTTTKSPTTSESKSISNHDTLSDEQTFNVSTTTSSSSASANTVISNKPDEHIDNNYSYDSLAQSLSALNVTNESKLKSDVKKQLRSLCDSQCLPELNLVDAQPPCQLMIKLLPYVASLNLHISQLLVCAFSIFRFRTHHLTTRMMY